MPSRLLSFLGALVLTGGVIYALSISIGGVPPLGSLLDPADGLYRSARNVTSASDSVELQLPALEGPVTIVRDDRHVPHIFAEHDRDAIIALGYVTAQDRLFQLDFLPRVASGRLSEAFGSGSVASDRFLRSTGMEWGAQKNLERIRSEQDIEWDLIQWYGAGVNAYLDELDRADWPLEFRLLGYAPDRYTPIQAMRVLQYMTYDLTYGSDDAAYATLQRRLDPADYDLLYPNHPRMYVPIIPPEQQRTGESTTTAEPMGVDATAWSEALALLRERAGRQAALGGTAAEGVRPGKGSNNWAVSGDRSTTGAPLLANDMHLSLTLPAIWYEAHLVTPHMNTYGVSVPGAPILIQSVNSHLGWGFTNTGSDQVDHLALELDSTGQRYRFEGKWRDLEMRLDTIRVQGAAPVVDTLYYSHHGPVDLDAEDAPTGALALRWVAHKPSRTLEALWGMNRATSIGEFEQALRQWDAPMQNIIYADTSGHIAIRSAGYMPVRRSGHGRGLLDGSTDAFDWVGRVPFEELPYARDPEQGFLASANQMPTGSDYPHYLNHDWRDGYRSLRLDTLLRGNARHSVDDMKAYQADVHAMQHDLFVPLLDRADDLSPRADTLRHLLHNWSGATTVDRPEPLVLDEFMQALKRLTWDEDAFRGVPNPQDAQLRHLLRERPDSEWLDVQATPEREDASGLLARALDATADTLAARYGWDVENWRWGEHHNIIFRHLTQSEALRPLWRGPFEYPGFNATLSPARDRMTTHSASWRIVADFSTSSPTAYGVYPGGQSGNPLHPRFYDQHLPTYLGFEYNRLPMPSAPEDMPSDIRSRRLELLPAEQ